MSIKEYKPSDKILSLELKISHFLRSGVLFAGLLLLVGWLWMSIQEGNVLADFGTYKAQSFLESIQWALLTNNRAQLMTMTGLVVLVLLPVARVFLTGILFIKQKEYRLALMALAVFLILLASFSLGVDL